VALGVAGQQPIDTHPKSFFNAEQNVRWRGNSPSLIFRELALADAKLLSEFILSDVETSQLPDSSPKGLHIGHGTFFAAQFSA
jgi:hypothetical protein